MKKDKLKKIVDYLETTVWGFLVFTDIFKISGSNLSELKISVQNDTYLKLAAVSFILSICFCILVITLPTVVSVVITKIESAIERARESLAMYSHIALFGIALFCIVKGERIGIVLLLIELRRIKHILGDPKERRACQSKY